MLNLDEACHKVMINIPTYHICSDLQFQMSFSVELRHGVLFQHTLAVSQDHDQFDHNVPQWHTLSLSSGYSRLVHMLGNLQACFWTSLSPSPARSSALFGDSTRAAGAGAAPLLFEPRRSTILM